MADESKRLVAMGRQRSPLTQQGGQVVAEAYSPVMSGWSSAPLVGKSARTKEHSVNVMIRSTQPGDHAGVLQVVRDAFTSDNADGTDEVDVVTTTWAKRACPDGFDLVAIHGDEVIGHVMAGVGLLGETPAIGIAPLSVSPSHQGHGVGSALMRELVDRIDRAGWPFAVLLGSPTYYPRFGFEAAANHGIVYSPVGEHPAFQIRRQDPEVSLPRGEFVYCFEMP